MSVGSRDQRQDIGLPWHLTDELSHAKQLSRVAAFTVDDVVILHWQLCDIDEPLVVNCR